MTKDDRSAISGKDYTRFFRKPDPLRLRANMRMLGKSLYPYYTDVYGSRASERVYTAKP